MSSELITLSSEELQEVKKVAGDDALFKSTMLVEIKLMTKKVDLINGNVRTHNTEIASLGASRTFYNWFMSGCVAGAAIILRCLFIVWGKIEALASHVDVLK